MSGLTCQCWRDGRRCEAAATSGWSIPGSAIAGAVVQPIALCASCAKFMEATKAPRRADARRDADGHCTVCGLELDEYGETEQDHVCPPGFSTARRPTICEPRAVPTDPVAAVDKATMSIAFFLGDLRSARAKEGK